VFRVEVAAVPVKVGPALTEALAPVEIVMSLGSSSSVPVLPSGARVSTLPAKTSVCLPDTSTRPPLPPRRAAARRDRAGEAGRVVGPDDHLAAMRLRRARRR
jgi:hypothetical protein